LLELISRECSEPHDSIFTTLGSPLCQFFTSLTSHYVFTKHGVKAGSSAVAAQWVKPDEGSADTWSRITTKCSHLFGGGLVN